MDTINISLQWKVIKVLNGGFFEEIQNQKQLFKIAPNKKFYSQFGLPWKHSYVPHILTPSPNFHREAKQFLKVKFNVRLKQQNFLYHLYIKEWKREVALNVDFRLFPPSILSLTVKLLDFKMPQPVDIYKLINYQQLSQIPLLREFMRWIIELIAPVDKNSLPTTFVFKPLISLCDVCSIEEFENYFDAHKIDFIGILIRNDKFDSMDIKIPERILEKNRELNLKTSKEKLLIDKQGILHLAPANITKKHHSKSILHDLLELALVIEAFLTNYHSFRYSQEDYSDYLLYKLEPWIEEPDVIFRKSVSNKEIWKLLIEEFYLKPIKDHTIDENIRRILDEKRKLFEEFTVTKWWELENFPNLISTKVKESKGFKLAFLGNKDLEEIITHDYDEAERCLYSKNYKATILLCGSIVEAILTAMLDEKHMICLSNSDYVSFVAKYPHTMTVLDSLKIYFDKSTFPIEYLDLKRPLGNLITDKVYIDIDRISVSQQNQLGAVELNELKTYSKKLIPTQKLYNLALTVLVDTVKIFKLISDDNIFSYINPLRNYRNAIHPGVQIRKTIKLDQSKATIAIETVNLLVKYFNETKWTAPSTGK